jgi:hypothetical protein
MVGIFIIKVYITLLHKYLEAYTKIGRPGLILKIHFSEEFHQRVAIG